MDTPMTKERLEQYLPLKREIDSQRERLVCLALAVLSPKSAVPSKTGGRRGSSQDILGDRIAEKIGLEVSIQLNLDLLETEARAIELAIQSLDNSVEREIMRLRYLDGLGWDEIGKKVGYSIQRVFQLHRAVLKRLE